MRWKFGKPDEAELSERQRVIEQIERWWATFVARVGDIAAIFDGSQDWDLAAWMQEHLGAIDIRLCWEFGPNPDDDSGHCLVITPESERQLRPLVDEILARAPQLPGWSFFPHRQPEDLAQAKLTVEGRTGGSLEDITVCVSLDEHRRIELIFVGPDYTEGDDSQRYQAFVATESLLGEEVLDRWVSVIDVTPQATKKQLPLERLRQTVMSLVVSSIDQLPGEPYFAQAGEHEYALIRAAEPEDFEGQPNEQGDYARRDDLFVGVSRLPEMFLCSCRGGAFFSECFSRCGEIFCYVKIDGSAGLNEERFADREAIEDALNDALTKAKVGCVLGGGTGLRYSYVDMALVDVERGADIVRHVLRQGDIPRRTWILFHDSTWQDEWIGVWDETPPPPQPPGDDA